MLENEARAKNKSKILTTPEILHALQGLVKILDIWVFPEKLSLSRNSRHAWRFKKILPFEEYFTLKLVYS